jgi:hypothetical protein
MKKWIVVACFLILPTICAQTIGAFLYTEKIDPFTDQDTSYIATSAEGSQGSLFFRCNNKELEIYVATGYLNSKDPVPVKYRFDKNPAVDSVWDISTSGTAAFIRYPKPFIQEAWSAKSFVIRLTKYSGETVTESFSIDGFPEAFSKLKCAAQFIPTP